MERRKALLPVLAAIAGNAFWGFSYLFNRVALAETTPELMLAIRFLISFLLMNVPVLLGRQKLRLKGKKVLPLLALAVAEPVCFYSESYGILYTNATFAGVIVAVAPLFAVLLAALVLKEYPSRRQALYCLLPVAGVIIMVLSGKSLGVVTPLGVAFMLLDCVAIAFYRLFNRWSSREFTPFERTYVMFAFGSVVFTVIALFQNKGDVSALLLPLSNPRFWIPLLYLAVLSSVCAFMLANYGLNYVSVSKSALYSNFTTVVSVLAGILIMKDAFTPLQLVGVVIIIVSVFGVSYQKEPAEEHQPSVGE